MTIQLHSPAFEDGQKIPEKYTADGDNVSPPLEWNGVPDTAKELVLIVDDPDAPAREPFVHWDIYKIPTKAGSLPEGVPHQPKLENGEMQGKNSMGKIGYDGPAPPKGHGVHHYHFHMYAVDQPLNLQAGLTKEALMNAMSGHVVAEGEMVGTYQR